MSETAVRAVRGLWPLRVVEPPLALPSYAVNLLWHPRLDNEPANQWLRDVFARAAREITLGRAAPAPKRSPSHRSR